MSVYTLFFGRGIQGHTFVTDAQWQAFLYTTITSNLPDGYTLMDANGSWMDPANSRTIQEATKVLVAAMPETPESLAAIDRVRTAYQDKYHQKVVGMLVQQGCGIF
jgi:hypothetical protein